MRTSERGSTPGEASAAAEPGVGRRDAPSRLTVLAVLLVVGLVFLAAWRVWRSDEPAPSAGENKITVVRGAPERAPAAPRPEPTTAPPPAAGLSYAPANVDAADEPVRAATEAEVLEAERRTYEEQLRMERGRQ